MAAAQNVAQPIWRLYDNSGNLAVGGKVYTYAAGTTTPLATYTDSTAGTPNTNPIVADARGEFQAWLDNSKTYKFVAQDSAGNELWSVDNINAGFVAPSHVLSVLDYATAGGGVDAATGMENALAAAAAIGGATNSGAPTRLDGGGRVFALSAPAVLTGRKNVRLTNCTLIPWGAYSGDLVQIGNNGDSNGAFNAGLEGVTLDCLHQCTGIDHNKTSGAFFLDVLVLHYTTYGIHIHNKCTDSQYWAVDTKQYVNGETGWDVAANRTGKGIWNESSDVQFYGCDSSYAKYPVYADNLFGMTWTGGHVYNGGTTPTTYTILGATNNGSGLVRLQFSSTSGITTGDLMNVPGLTGIDDTAGGGNARGVWAATVVDSTHIDLAGTTFGGTYSGSGQTCMRNADEPVSFYLGAAANQVFISPTTEIDNGKLLSLTSSFSYRGFTQKNASGSDFWGVEIQTSTTNDPLDGLHIDAWFANGLIRPVQLTTTGSGSISNPIDGIICANVRNGAPPPQARGITVVDQGTAANPSLQFTKVATQKADGGTGLHGDDAADCFGASSNGVDQWFVTPTGLKQAATGTLSATPTLSITSNTIAPSKPLSILGAGLVKTITPPAHFDHGGWIRIIPSAAFTWDATGNIAIAGTAVVGRPVEFSYEATVGKWYPSYVS